MKTPKDNEPKADPENTESVTDAPTANVPDPKDSRFRNELETLLNCHSKENGCNTPDFILADYLTTCLTAFDAAVERRERWYGREPVPVDAPVDSPNAAGERA